MCAARTGQLLNLSGPANDCGMTHNTAKAWVSVLEASYIVFLLQPYYRNLNKRLVKTPKLYFYDPGLAAWLSGIQAAEQLATHGIRGALFETWVVSEMLKQRYDQALPANVYFWRDRAGNEVDILCEEGGRASPMEIKSGRTIADEHLAGLRRWIELAGKIAIEPRLLYAGSNRYVRSGIEILPWTGFA